MRLTILGSGDAFGSGGRFNACFRVESAKAAILIDCGASSLVALKARGIDPNHLDGVFSLTCMAITSVGCRSSSSTRSI
jgi:ribonuclease BN (tRNA processing enzyme)